jgi:hypothetical protein
MLADIESVIDIDMETTQDIEADDKMKTFRGLQGLLIITSSKER